MFEEKQKHKYAATKRPITLPFHHFQRIDSSVLESGTMNHPCSSHSSEWQPIWAGSNARNISLRTPFLWVKDLAESQCTSDSWSSGSVHPADGHYIVQHLLYRPKGITHPLQLGILLYTSSSNHSGYRNRQTRLLRRFRAGLLSHKWLAKLDCHTLGCRMVDCWRQDWRRSSRVTRCRRVGSCIDTVKWRLLYGQLGIQANLLHGIKVTGHLWYYSQRPVFPLGVSQIWIKTYLGLNW